MVVGIGLVLLLKASRAVFDFPWKGGQGESSQVCAGSGDMPSQHGDKEGDFGQGQRGWVILETPKSHPHTCGTQGLSAETTPPANRLL